MFCKVRGRRIIALEKSLGFLGPGFFMFKIRRRSIIAISNLMEIILWSLGNIIYCGYTILLEFLKIYMTGGTVYFIL
jgi:hypothetical protein